MANAVVGDILQFAARYGNKVIQAQVKLDAPLWGELEHIPMSGQVASINIIAAGQQAAKFIEDGGTRSAGASNTPVQGTVRPVFLDCPLILNKGVLMTLNGKADSAKYADTQLKSAGASLAQAIGSAAYAGAGTGTSLTSTSGMIAQATGGGALNVTVASPAGFKEGMAVEVLDTSAAGGLVYTLRVGAVTLSTTTFGATITFVNDVALAAGQTLATPPSFTATARVFQRGTFQLTSANAQVTPPLRLSTGSSASAGGPSAPVGLANLAAVGNGGSDVYGIAAAAGGPIGWVGNKFDLSGAGDPSQEAFLLRMKRIKQKSGVHPDLVVVGPMTAMALGFSALTPATAAGLGSAVGSGARKEVSKLDKYGRDISNDSGVSLGGKRVLEDQNLDDSKAYLLSTEHTKYGVWQDIEADTQGGDTLLVKQDAFSMVAFYNCGFNLICDQVNTVGEMSGLDTAFGA